LIQFSNNLPIYIQIMDYIKEQMINKSLQLGAKMPSVRDFSAELGVNPTTVQRAYKELEDENILVPQRGIGSFITQDSSVLESLMDSVANQMLSEFIEKINKLGFDSDKIIAMLQSRMEAGND